MRRVDSCSSAASAARRERRGDPAQRGAGRRRRRARRRASSHSCVDAGGRERLGEPPRPPATPSSSSASSSVVLGVGGVERVERASAPPRRSTASRCSATSSSAPARARRPPRRSAPTSTLSTSSASASRPRPRARGGRRVVELVREPGRHRARATRAARGSARCAVMRLITGATWRHDPAVHRRLGEREPQEVARLGITATRHVGLGLHPHRRAAPPVSTAIAPIQVGACWRPTGSVRSPSTQHRLDRALEQQLHARRASSPCSASDVARRELARARRPRPSGSSSSSSRSSNRSTRRSSATVTASRSCVGQVLVDERDRHRALADGAGDALDRAGAHVAGHEHAGHAWSRAGTGRA